jgi:protein O-mannosyl-transferase
VIACALGVAALAGLEVSASAALAPTWHSSRTLWEHAVAAQPRAFLAHIKYAEILEDARQWQPAAAQLQLAHELNRPSTVPLQQLFQLDAARAETAGTIAPGTSVRWVNQLDRALVDLNAFQQLAAEVDTTRCKTCSHALLVIQLAAWPVSDLQLLVLARQARDAHASDRARIYLAQVRDRTLPELAELTALSPPPGQLDPASSSAARGP